MKALVFFSNCGLFLLLRDASPLMCPNDCVNHSEVSCQVIQPRLIAPSCQQFIQAVSSQTKLSSLNPSCQQSTQAVSSLPNLSAVNPSFQQSTKDNSSPLKLSAVNPSFQQSTQAVNSPLNLSAFHPRCQQSTIQNSVLSFTGHSGKV